MMSNASKENVFLTGYYRNSSPKCKILPTSVMDIIKSFYHHTGFEIKLIESNIEKKEHTVRSYTVQDIFGTSYGPIITEEHNKYYGSDETTNINTLKIDSFEFMCYECNSRYDYSKTVTIKENNETIYNHDIFSGDTYEHDTVNSECDMDEIKQKIADLYLVTVDVLVQNIKKCNIPLFQT